MVKNTIFAIDRSIPNSNSAQIVKTDQIISIKQDSYDRINRWNNKIFIIDLDFINYYFKNLPLMARAERVNHYFSGVGYNITKSNQHLVGDIIISWLADIFQLSFLNLQLITLFKSNTTNFWMTLRNYWVYENIMSPIMKIGQQGCSINLIISSNSYIRLYT